MNNKKIMSKKNYAIVGFLLGLFFLSGFQIIPSGEVGFISNFGVINPKTKNPGMAYAVPFLQTLKTINIQKTSYNEEMNVFSLDGQRINIAGVVNFNASQANAAKALIEYGSTENIKKSHLKPSVDSTVRQVLNQYTMNDVLAKQADIAEEIETRLKKLFNEAGYINYDGFQISNISVDPDVQTAIEQTAIAKQKDVQQSYLLKVSEKQAQINANNSKGLTPELVKLETARTIAKAWDGKGIVPNATLMTGEAAVTAPTK